MKPSPQKQLSYISKQHYYYPNKSLKFLRRHHCMTPFIFCSNLNRSSSMTRRKLQVQKYSNSFNLFKYYAYKSKNPSLELLELHANINHSNKKVCKKLSNQTHKPIASDISESQPLVFASSDQIFLIELGLYWIQID